MPRLIYRNGPPSVGFEVRGRTVVVTRGRPSEELPEDLVKAVLARKPPIADWKAATPPRAGRKKDDPEEAASAGSKGQTKGGKG